jgi:hypothetical protein
LIDKVVVFVPNEQSPEAADPRDCAFNFSIGVGSLPTETLSRIPSTSVTPQQAKHFRSGMRVEFPGHPPTPATLYLFRVWFCALIPGRSIEEVQLVLSELNNAAQKKKSC